MAQRLLEVFLPSKALSSLEMLLEEQGMTRRWTTESGEFSTVRVLLDSNEIEGLMDPLEGRFSHFSKFHVVVLAAEACLPRDPKAQASKPEGEAQKASHSRKKRPLFRVSRDELLNDIQEGVTFDRIFLTMVVLSTIVAVTGLVRGSAAVVIGAMVIAPLLGPNIGLALATTLGDHVLARRALRTGMLGLLVAACISAFLGLLFHVDPDGPEIMLRTSLAPSDIVLALASGAAGALAFTTGSGASLVGVMVAVALLPPLATASMLAISGHFAEAARALLLLGVNLVCINLAGVATFLGQGIGPRRWHEEQAAKKATRRALVSWSVLLAALTALLILAGNLAKHDAQDAAPSGAPGQTTLPQGDR